MRYWTVGNPHVIQEKTQHHIYLLVMITYMQQSIKFAMVTGWNSSYWRRLVSTQREHLTHSGWNNQAIESMFVKSIMYANIPETVSDRLVDMSERVVENYNKELIPASAKVVSSWMILRSIHSGKICTSIRTTII